MSNSLGTNGIWLEIFSKVNGYSFTVIKGIQTNALPWVKCNYIKWAYAWFFQNSRICRPRSRTKTFLHWNHVGLVFAVRNGSKNVQEVYIVYRISLAHAHHPFSPCSLPLAHGLNGLHKPSDFLLGLEMGRRGSWARLGCLSPWVPPFWVALCWLYPSGGALLLWRQPPPQDSLLPAYSPGPALLFLVCGLHLYSLHFSF